MDLYFGVLAWLPLDQLLPWLSFRGSLSQLARIRAASVNRLSDAELMGYLQLPEWSKLTENHRYLGICTYQGELSEIAPMFLEADFLVRRAIFIRDYQAFSRWIPDGLALYSQLYELTLQTGDPRFQAKVLSTTTPRPFAINDPESIAPTPQLRRVLNVISDRVVQDQQIRGWFHLSGLGREYSVYYLRAGGRPDDFGPTWTALSPEERELVSALGNQELPEFRDGNLLAITLGKMSPRTLESILRRHSVQLPDDFPTVPKLGYLRYVPDFLRLAEQYPAAFATAPSFLAWLRIVSGMPLGHMGRNRSAELSQAMINVAHPELEQADIDKVLAANEAVVLNEDGLIYDVDRLMILRFDTLLEDNDVAVLYERGRLLRHRLTGSVDVWFRGNQSRIDETDSSADVLRYHTLYATLTG